MNHFNPEILSKIASARYYKESNALHLTYEGITFIYCWYLDGFNIMCDVKKNYNSGETFTLTEDNVSFLKTVISKSTR